MGWSIGYDSNWQRDIGYGVPAWCDHPDCNEKIDRGLGYVCGGIVYGGDCGCGLFFCGKHIYMHRERGQVCWSCYDRRRKPLTAKPDHPEWVEWKLTHESWQQWRDENPLLVAKMKSSHE